MPRSEVREISTHQRVEEAKIRKQIAEQARQFIHDDNDNPEDYQHDFSRFEKSADGTKYRHRLFESKPIDENDVGEEDDEEEIQLAGSEKKERIVEHPTLKQLIGETTFDPLTYVSESDKQIDQLIQNYGHIRPNSSHARRFIDEQIKKEANSKQSGDIDLVRLRLNWEARLSMAHLMSRAKLKSESKSSTDASAPLPSAWSAGPPIPKDKPRKKNLLSKDRRLDKKMVVPKIEIPKIDVQKQVKQAKSDKPKPTITVLNGPIKKRRMLIPESPSSMRLIDPQEVEDRDQLFRRYNVPEPKLPNRKRQKLS